MIAFLPRRALGVLLALAILMVATYAIAQERLVQVRSADHDDYSRVVFDFRQRAGYDAEIRDGQIAVSLELPADTQFVGLSELSLERLKEPQLRQNDGGITVLFQVSSGARLRHFTAGNRLVIDAVDAIASPRELGEAVDSTRVVVTNDDDPGDHLQAGSSQGSDARAIAAAANAPVGDDSGSLVANSDIASQAEVGSDDSDSSELPELGFEVAAGDLVIDQMTLPDEARLLFGFDRVVPAAMFQRAGYLWMVFEGRHRVDRSRLPRNDRSSLARTRGMEIIDDPDSIVLRFDMRPNQGVSVDLNETTWIVTLKDLPGGPRRPLQISRQVTGQAGGRLFIEADDVGSRIRLSDPEVGDMIDVVPLGQPSSGISVERSYAKFALLSTAQGIAVQHIADDIVVQRFRNGVAVSGPEGLALSQPGMVPGLNSRSSAQTGTSPLKLVDLDAWRLGPERRFMQIKQQLSRQMALTPRDERNPLRWEIAKFRLAHGQATEALGIMQLMVETEPQLEQNPEFLAARGVAGLMTGRFEAAANDLSHSDLDPEPEAALWRSMAAEALGQHRKALDQYRRGIDALPFYDPEQRVRFQLSAVRAAMAENSIEIAARELDLARDEPVGPYLSAEVTYWLGRLAEAEGDVGVAVARYEDVASSENRRAAAMAQFRRIDFARREEGLDPQDAIDQLERLRFAWRGDKFELTLLEVLGTLYVDTGQYRTGLETLRQAVTHFPEAQRSRVITAEMTRAFRALFLDGAADELSPVAALGLFYDFQELTPLGPDGDTMIRRLADRLVAVDLLDRAADLLKHQVTFRLEGAAQALIAVRLAKVYLLDGQPGEAVGILRATRQDRLPEDVIRERRLVEARALVEQARFEEAEVLIEPYRSVAADLIRLDSAWAARDWSKVDRVAGRLLGGRYEDDSPLIGVERQFLIRQAIAKTFREDVDGLERMRSRYQDQMRSGAFASTFDRLTDIDNLATTDIQDVLRDVAAAQRFQSFLSAYRDDFTRSDVTADDIADTAVGSGTGQP